MDYVRPGRPEKPKRKQVNRVNELGDLNMQYVRNNWYPVAWSHDIEHSLTRRTVLKENIVLYRTTDGRVAALADLCPHRFLPLSLGRLNGNNVECGYHGTTFDCNGKCVRVPGQDIIPRDAVVKSYPVVENMGTVWLWMGDPKAADQDKVYNLPEFHDSKWSIVFGDALHIKADYLSLAENLTDPSHVSFVHPTTLGTSSGQNAPVQNEKRDNTIVVWRWIMNVDPIPLFAKYGNFKGNVDRWQYYYYHVPSVAMIDFGNVETGVISEGDRSKGLRMFTGHFITPVDDRTCIDHWLNLRNFSHNDREIDDQIRKDLRAAFAEDKAVLEAIQQEVDVNSNLKPIHLAIDAGPLRMRRILDQMISQEKNVTTAVA